MFMVAVTRVRVFPRRAGAGEAKHQPVSLAMGKRGGLPDSVGCSVRASETEDGGCTTDQLQQKTRRPRIPREGSLRGSE